MTVNVHNTSDLIIRGITLQLMELKFPAPPRGWIEHHPVLGHNLGTPTVNYANVGTAALAVCNDDIGRPLLVGFPGRQSLTVSPLWVSSANIGWLSPLLDPYLNRPIYPGGTDQYNVSLRFGPAGTPATELAGDIYRKFAADYPFQIKWDDRRPIGALFLSSSDLNSPTNPRGWFNDKNLNTTSEAGRAQFKARLLAYADTSIKIIKEMGAQGMIAWDPEGQEFPHATSYLGDPRSLPAEVEPIIDEFFQKFTAAGLRTGICIRPQLPVRAAYGGGVFQTEVPDPAANLIAKIAHAKKRWGATLYYVDSNGDPNVPFDALIFKRVAEAHPDVLLMPEHENTQYYAYTAPYQSFAHFGTTSTPASVRSVYPGAFSVNYAADGPFEQKRAELVEAVRRGDILVFRGWFDDPNNAKIKSIYEEARKR